jgi:hypothetical protein
LRQPFASDSIWNMPLGSGAIFALHNLDDWGGAWGVFVEENLVFMDRTQPMTPMWHSNDAWTGGSRCNAEGTYTRGGGQFFAPLPPNYIVPGVTGGDTPNNAAAILMPDGVSLFQPQPLTHCSVGGPWTALTDYPQGGQPLVSIRGDGIIGAQGGSGMSSLGGVIRVGEFTSGVIPHALKLVVDSDELSSTGGSFKWPAIKADSCAPGCYTGGNVNVKMGALIAVPMSFNCASLRTVPGRVVCRAMQTHGSYIVDTGWAPVYLGGVEVGPAGDVRQEFLQLYGFAMHSSNSGNAWALDWKQIVQTARVVTNTSPTQPKGGGSPVVGLAPPLAP